MSSPVPLIALVREPARSWLCAAVDLARPLDLVHQVRASYFAARGRGAGEREAAESAVLEWVVPEWPAIVEVVRG